VCPVENAHYRTLPRVVVVSLIFPLFPLASRSFPPPPFAREPRTSRCGRANEKRRGFLHSFPVSYAALFYALSPPLLFLVPLLTTCPQSASVSGCTTFAWVELARSSCPRFPLLPLMSLFAASPRPVATASTIRFSYSCDRGFVCSALLCTLSRAFLLRGLISARGSYLSKVQLKSSLFTKMKFEDGFCFFPHQHWKMVMVTCEFTDFWYRLEEPSFLMYRLLSPLRIPVAVSIPRYPDSLKRGSDHCLHTFLSQRFSPLAKDRDIRFGPTTF